MSYEGHEQHLCAQGHLWVEPCSYGEPNEPCYVCKGPSVWCNAVDDTNCDSVGEILPEGWKSLELTPAVLETCNLGHPHVTRAATYRQPTELELEALRHYWDGAQEKWIPLSRVPNA
jgi:hypothetical protein